MSKGRRAFIVGIACVTAALGALAGATYFSTASAGTVLVRVVPAELPRIAAEKARNERIGSLEFLSTVEEGHLGVVFGSDQERPVAAFASRDVVTPFARVDTVVDTSDLTVFSTAGGSATGFVDWADVAGIVSHRVAMVEVISADGAVREVELTKGAFAYSAQNERDFATSVAAYDAAGATIASESIPAPSPAATG